MKKFGIVAVLLCLFAVPALAAPGEITFGLDGGMGIPMGDFGKAFKAGFNGGVFADYMVTDMFAIGVDGSYNQFKGKDVPFSIDIPTVGTLNVTDEKFTVLQFGAHVKVAPAMKDMPLAPYLQVGAGIYSGKDEVTADLDGVDESTSASKSKFGYNIGIGADYKATPQIGVGVFGTFHSIMNAFEAVGGTEKKSANYVAVGLKVSFSTAATTTTKTTTP